jgi:histidinol-phosphate/aromatic aminotransferase/cobyric acid decarboxylase-like protein
LYARHLRHVRSDAPRWRSDPHNPTGVLAPRDDRSFVRDEAFYPLTGAGWTRGDPDTIVVGSLTKLFACPGLRAGYIVARDPDEAAALAASRPEWTVNGLACAVIPDLLAATDLAVMAREVRALRQRLEALLTRHGLAPTAGSAANYVWIDRAPGLRARLLPHLIVLRDGGSFGRPDAVRIAVPDAAGLDRLAVALDHITERSEA